MRKITSHKRLYLFLLMLFLMGIFAYPVIKARAIGQNGAVSVEAELGTLSGAVQVNNDTTASNGQYIIFNSPLTPTPTPTQLALSNLTVADTTNAKNYSIQSNIQAGNIMYGDRTYTIKTIPTSLTGSLWIRTANNSKTWNNGNTLISFQINKQATISVAVDTRLTRPSWIDNTWTNSGLKLTDSEGYTITFAIFQKVFPSGTVNLGPNAGVIYSDMYTVIAQ